MVVDDGRPSIMCFFGSSLISHFSDLIHINAFIDKIIRDFNKKDVEIVSCISIRLPHVPSDRS